MEELIDLIATDGAPSDISDRIKELLYTKAADRVDSARPKVATSIFGDENQLGDEE
jgi:hypothetical protein